MTDIAAARPVAGQPIETAWGQNVHDAIEGAPVVTFGTVSIDLAAGIGTAVVQFGVVYATAHSVTATARVSSDTVIVTTFGGSGADTGIRVANGGAGPMIVEWIAVGR